MEIKELGLLDYGKFHNKKIQFENGINLVFGENESGKSTTFSFISAIFYGFSKDSLKRRMYDDDKDKFKPWNYNNYRGYIEIKSKYNYRIERDFIDDKLQFLNIDLGEDLSEDIKLTEYSKIKQPGAYIFNINKETFLNSFYIGQLNSKVDKFSYEVLGKKISNFSNTNSEDIDVNKVKEILNDKLNSLGKESRKSTEIGICSNEILNLEKEVFKYREVLDKYEKLILEQESINLKLNSFNLDKDNNKKIEEQEIYNSICEKEKEIEKLKSYFKNIDIKDYQNLLELEKEQKKYSEEIFILKSEILHLQNNDNYLENSNINNLNNLNKNYLYILLSIVLIIIAIIFKKYYIIAISLIPILIFIKKNNKFKTKENFKNLDSTKGLEDKLKDLEKELVDIEININDILFKYKKSSVDDLKEFFLVNSDKVNKEKIDYLRDMIDILLKDRIKEELNHNIDLNNVESSEFIDIERNEDLKIQEIKNLQKIKDLEIQIKSMENLKEEISYKKIGLEILNKNKKDTEDALSIIESILEDNSGDLFPSIIFEMNNIISEITGGKYSEILLDRELNIKIKDESNNLFVELESLSNGTIDQIYLAFRIAIINIIDSNYPIILDDHFLQYDDGRLENTLNYLNNLSKNRQIIIFSATEREKNLFESCNIKYNFIDMRYI